tara:strand:+ start:1377 stop:2237 length:861 start_codon:yes stop_codon:yes gene_type:complete
MKALRWASRLKYQSAANLSLSHYGNSMLDFMSGVQASLLAFLEANQYTALALLITVEEAGVPLPLPGDLAVVFMGFQVSSGRAAALPVVLVTVASATLGASLLYWLSRIIGLTLVDRYGSYLRVTRPRLAKFEQWMNSHGALVIVFGRLIPGLRIAVAVGSGIAKVPFRHFVFYTGISSTIWASIYLSVGWILGSEWHRVDQFTGELINNPILLLGVGIAIGVVVARLIRWKQRPTEPASQLEESAQVDSLTDEADVIQTDNRIDRETTDIQGGSQYSINLDKADD